MLGEALGSALLGLAVACAALWSFPRRFGNPPLVLATGTIAAALGGLVTRAVLGPGHLGVSLLLAVAVAAALVSLLLDGRRAYSRPSWGHHR
ncbi:MULTISPECIES: hypothetical protein [unclassified Streptomyces]|uniref:hypothetical protein n=1 Tax=unclassified Streptomyces TaxID=2593676 RepID=UPI0022B6DED3|nr:MULTISPECIES: hypothetical protein [unclassified Streptomyces]MCZ7416682.1 hypothetical protein [Streptomyces sp. WMMC897]MCZ7433508.1 hypothetical protein [Streptomyces sp. WMMC1477]